MLKIWYFIKDYYYEILLFLIFIWLNFAHTWPSMIPPVFIWGVLVSFFLWFARIRKCKVFLPLLLDLFLTIPVRISTRQFPSFIFLEMLLFYYSSFSIASLIQIVEFWVKNKFFDKKEKLPQNYIITVLSIFIVCISVFYLMFSWIL